MNRAIRSIRLLPVDLILLPVKFLRSLHIDHSSLIWRIFTGGSWMSVLAAGFLSSCASTANVPLSYAKLDTGYLNSGIYDLGAIFVWDRTQQTLTPLPPLLVPKSMRDIGSTIDQQQNSLSSETEINFSGEVAKVATANLKAQIARSTTAELTNVASETVDSEDLLNLENDKTRAWRKRLATNYGGDVFRFLLVDRVIRGDKVYVALSNSSGGSAGANVVKYGKFDVKVTYSGKSSFTQTGKSAPLVFRARMFKLVKAEGDPQFVPLTGPETKQFNFQQAIKSSQ